ncbi:MAG: acyl-CoA thioesterase [Gemmatimonadales bacterium]
MTDPRHPLLADFPVVIGIDLAWSEMDAYQHLNNTVYVRYAETGRIAFFRAAGFMSDSAPTGIAPILHSIRCRFRIPLTFPDRVLVGTRGDTFLEDRFTTHFRIVSLKHDAVAAEGDGIVVSLDYGTGRKAPLPPDLRRRLEALHQQTG